MTVVVVVSSYSRQEFLAGYETLATYVVPRSCKQISSDTEFDLYTVCLFRRCFDEFRNNAREKRYTVREVDTNSLAPQASDGKGALEEQFETVKVTFSKWCTVNFGEAIALWMHLKAIRVFVEAILRFGLPPNFLAAVLKPNPKKDKNLKAALYDLFGKLGGSGFGGGSEADELSSEFHPYVFLTIETDTGGKV